MSSDVGVQVPPRARKSRARVLWTRALLFLLFGEPLGSRTTPDGSAPPKAGTNLLRVHPPRSGAERPRSLAVGSLLRSSSVGGESRVRRAAQVEQARFAANGRTGVESSVPKLRGLPLCASPSSFRSERSVVALLVAGWRSADGRRSEPHRLDEPKRRPHTTEPCQAGGRAKGERAKGATNTTAARKPPPPARRRSEPKASERGRPAPDLGGRTRRAFVPALGGAEGPGAFGNREVPLKGNSTPSCRCRRCVGRRCSLRLRRGRGRRR